MGWLPIETAPQDEGVRVDLWCLAADSRHELRVPDAYLFDGKWFVHGREITQAYGWKPLFWAPPPPPPEGH